MFQAMPKPTNSPNPNIFQTTQQKPQNNVPNANIFAPQQNSTSRMTPSNVQAQTVAPAQASGAGDFQRFENQAMQSAERHLNPTWDRNQKTFEQSMINKGFAPNSEGYNEAFDQFNRAKNDQYSSAAFNAMQFGLGAQNQAFGQDLANANLQQQGDMFNAGNKLNADIFNTNFGFQDRESNRSWDLNEMNTLAGLDMAYGDRDFRNQQYNDSRGDMQYNKLASILSGLSQQATPQVDTMGAYGLNTSANNAAYSAKMGNNQANMGGLVNLIGAGMNMYGSMG